MALARDVDLQRELLRIYGYREFRPNQREVIDALLCGRDVFVVMPTGGGKTLCYQLPAVISNGFTLVISPLIALMKDQVDAARANGIRAGVLNSSLEPAERAQTLDAMAADPGSEQALDLLYVAPERFADAAFNALLQRRPPALIAIDEAHCVSEWGHDFRPDYLRLGELTARCPGVPVAAFTATATRRVQADIVERLRLRSPHVVRASFDRPNLSYRVLLKDHQSSQINAFVRQRRGFPGIIYRSTRKRVEQTATALQAKGIRAAPYHAGLDEETRTRNQEQFKRDEIEVIVATIAFGMGIDKSNVRYVLHADIPKSLEGYYQESGRAGRDGEPAECVLLYGAGDVATARYFINRVSDAEQRARAARSLAEMVRYAGSTSCRRVQLLRYFGESWAGASDESCCDVCAGAVSSVDITREAQIVMSAVVRTGRRFGIGHIVDVVRGANTERIRTLGHDRIKTWGVGAELPAVHWRRVIDALLSDGLLVQTDEKYPVITLGNGAREVLSGERSAGMIAHRPARAPAVAADRAQRSIDHHNPVYGELFERLRRLRKQIADEKGVPAYIIFTDRTLSDMAERRPSTLEALAQVHGVGAAKLARYGERFLRAVTVLPSLRSE